MIILDSCVIRGMGLEDSKAELLRAIARTKTERVGAPWMVVEELVAQKALEYNSAHEAAASALAQLQRKSYRTEPELGAADPEGVRALWRVKYREILEVLPTSENALREGMYREANVLHPARRKGDVTKGVKVGARDVAIWLTAVEYAQNHPKETVYFVSENHTDFTKGTGAYPSPMDADVEGLGDRFRHLTNLDEVLDLVAPQVEVEAPDEPDVRSLLAERGADFVQWMLTKYWGITPSRGDFQTMTQAGTVELAKGWVDGRASLVELADVTDLKAYRLGAETYFVATVSWKIAGPVVTGNRLNLGACYWDTRLIVPRNPEGKLIHILRETTPVPVEDAAKVTWPPRLVPVEKSSALELLQNKHFASRKEQLGLTVLAVLEAMTMSPADRQELIESMRAHRDWTDSSGLEVEAKDLHGPAPLEDAPEDEEE
ncbi:PIN domain-containing protein [Streptomyces sp. NPDC058671]|uniref:PIN domain-containing protein n=1 Tax=Streptomyces sp. NPDC058671 TaxID=3346590 RepID=UPI00364E9079